MISSRLLASVIGSFVLGSALATPSVTYADSATRAPTAIVHYSDLNLDTPKGVEVLYRRIQSAAGKVCQSTEPYGTLLPSAIHRSCLRNAVARAVHEVGVESLEAYAAEHADHAVDQHWALNTATRAGS